MRHSSAAGAIVLCPLRQTDRRTGVANAAGSGARAGACAAPRILWLAFSAFNTIGGVILYVLANTLFAHMRELGAPEAQTAFLRPLLSVVAILLLAKAAIGFYAGWGLLQHERSARIVTLVLAFISMFVNIPFGTALGIYTMWVLLPQDSEREYEALVSVPAA